MEFTSAAFSTAWACVLRKVLHVLEGCRLLETARHRTADGKSMTGFLYMPGASSKSGIAFERAVFRITRPTTWGCHGFHAASAFSVRDQLCFLRASTIQTCSRSTSR